ncbi:hypothetical protein ERJ75_001554500 [Trypanosoma vivax]|nr:hypothetical protein TRVL_08606 [Trypanosoma vivax]KAH8606054.1 hypothetical protein ERJ75_001554500 [Trypanosoma vivax]
MEEAMLEIERHGLPRARRGGLLATAGTARNSWTSATTARGSVKDVRCAGAHIELANGEDRRKFELPQWSCVERSWRELACSERKTANDISERRNEHLMYAAEDLAHLHRASPERK